MKRLFLFAAYDPLNVVGAMLVHFVESLSRCGDVVLCADSDIPPAELEKLGGFVLHCEAVRHREYDFGSYKRCWQWAESNIDLAVYDVVYLVNDSVYGPYAEIGPVLEKLESSGADAFAMVNNPSRHRRHLQSWFIGLRKAVFASGWFDSFIGSVRRMDDKIAVCQAYETGFSSLLRSHGAELSAVCDAPGRVVYNRPLRVFKAGVPFVKKSSFTRHNGCLGGQLKRILDRVSPELKAFTLDDVALHNGAGYASSLLSGNPFILAGRYLRYLYGKVFRQV